MIRFRGLVTPQPVVTPVVTLYPCRDCGAMTPAKFCCLTCVHGKPAPKRDRAAYMRDYRARKKVAP